MILTGDEIVRMRAEGRVVVEPFVPEHVGANSVDLRLADELLQYTGLTLDMKADNPTEAVRIPPGGLVLEPGRLYLGSTVEKCGSDEFVCEVDGRSSVGRLGISVHCTACRGDLFFSDRWTLEINVVKPVRVYANVRIAQATFFATLGERGRRYQGKYKGQTGATASRMWRDFQEGGK